MATMDFTRRAPAPDALPRAVELVAFALIVAHAVYLITAFVQGIWVIAPNGSGIDSDFVNVWAAGKLALQGNAPAAYDWPTHKLVEEAAVGHPFEGYYGWHYPPPFLFAARALATIPYTTAFLLWVFATFPAYLVAIRAIIGERSGYFLAAAFPAVLANFIPGQNGFLTAGLMGGALLLIGARPVLGGVCLGLLTYKPHLGLLFPIVLAASGHWRAFVSAGITACLMAGASWLAFGTETWLAFFHSISHTSQAFLSDGWADWSKLQTVFGLSRILGAPETAAWALQFSIAALAAIVVSLIWRRAVPYEIKAATLATGAVLATPYLYTYDLVILAIPLAFLFRLGRRDGFLSYELAGMGVACALVFLYAFVRLPTGLAAACVIAALILRRVAARPAQHAPA
jgi:hypothetical protein